jgi:aspartyl-tRNA(Asn)/glutamyl-tRNA(Gln) amidotransferase subunit B
VTKEVIAGNSAAVADYASGKEQALTFIIGQVMKATRGRANAGMVKEIILEQLGGK